MLIAALALLLQHGLNSLRIILNNTFEQKVIFDLRSDLYSHIQMLPLRWFDNRATGDLMTRILEDVNSVERMLIDGVEQGVVAVLQVVIVLGMMFYVSASLTLVGLAPAPFLAGGALWYTLTAHRRYRVQRRASSAMNSLLHDNLAGIRQIKSFVREGEEHKRFNSVSDQLRHATLVVMRVWAVYHPSMYRDRLARHRPRRVGRRTRGARRHDAGRRLDRVPHADRIPLRADQQTASAESARAGWARGGRTRVRDHRHADRAGLGAWNAPSGEIRGDVRFNDVSFSYGEGTSALQHISLHARPGETVALVGTTGAGKSTLVNLLSRFYEYDSGEILIDDKPLRAYGTKRLREFVGVVTQESFLFNGTVRENLLNGEPGCDGRGTLAGRGGCERAHLHRSHAEGAGQHRRRARREAERR